MLKIKDLPIAGYKKVVEGTDTDSGLHCFIAIHNTTLGPALGGIRIFPYPTDQDALNDVLRLAKAMTYKSAIAEDGMGGGKSVIIADPKKNKSEKLLLAFGEVVHSLHGNYIAAEDIGSNTEDMIVIRRKTPYVAALPTDKSSGDPSRFTAWGVFRGIQAVCHHLYGKNSLRKKRILIQGLGSVGSKLANILFWEGADLILSELDEKTLHELAILYGAEIVQPDKIYETPCDIFAPCAMGGIINTQTVKNLRCKAIAGAANNQLQSPEIGEELMKRGILYAPDYIINAGGIINAAAEFEPEGYNPKATLEKVNHIYDTLLHLFEKAAQEGKPTSLTADEIAEYNLKNKIGARKAPINFLY
jgi:leucine dehydrogenase